MVNASPTSVVTPCTFLYHTKKCMENSVTLDGQDSRNAKVGRLLLWEGRVSRGRIMQEFGLGPVRASQWLRDFRDAHSDWARWDSRRREYTATPMAYQRADALARQERTAFLAEMLSPYSPAELERYSVVPWDLQHPSVHIFSRLNIAIADGMQVAFTYSSMGHPAPHARTIEPHNLVLAGRRWHVRGYCLETRAFRDFVLGRMGALRLLDAPRSIDPSTDHAWFTMVNVRIKAHPALTPAQQIVVRDEMFRGTAARVEQCRGALLPYMLQELRVAIDTGKQHPPDYQLAVGNPKECQPWLLPI